MASLHLITLLLPIPVKWVNTNYKLESAGKINVKVCMFISCTPRQKLEVSLSLRLCLLLTALVNLHKIITLDVSCASYCMESG
jgi:hypothetical protein